MLNDVIFSSKQTHRICKTLLILLSLFSVGKKYIALPLIQQTITYRKAFLYTGIY